MRCYSDVVTRKYLCIIYKRKSEVRRRSENLVEISKNVN